MSARWSWKLLDRPLPLVSRSATSRQPSQPSVKLVSGIIGRDYGQLLERHAPTRSSLCLAAKFISLFFCLPPLSRSLLESCSNFLIWFWFLGRTCMSRIFLSYYDWTILKDAIPRLGIIVFLRMIFKISRIYSNEYEYIRVLGNMKYHELYDSLLELFMIE